MHIAVVDDERLIRKDLIGYIKMLRPDAEVCEADCGEQAVKLASESDVDIFFLDINLGDINGTVLALMVEQIRPQAAIIFVTAYDEYGVKAFELNAVDYVMKPFGKERIERALKKAETHLYRSTDDNSQVESPVTKENPIARDDSIIVRHGKTVTILLKSELVFIESKQRSCRVCCKNGSAYVTSQPLSFFVEELQKQHFMRIHKSFLINLNEIVEITPLYGKHYCVKLRGYEKEALPIGRTQMKQLRDWYQF